MDIVVAAVVGLIGGLIGRGGVAGIVTAWSQRSVGPASALSELEPSIVAHLHRLDQEVRQLRDENAQLRRELSDLRDKLRLESRLRRKYEAMLIEHRILDRVDEIAEILDLDPPETSG